jgi:hypothetical protein
MEAKQNLEALCRVTVRVPPSKVFRRKPRFFTVRGGAPFALTRANLDNPRQYRYLLRKDYTL